MQMKSNKQYNKLELAYIEARNDANINQLLLTPFEILDYLCIHPFHEISIAKRGY